MGKKVNKDINLVLPSLLIERLKAEWAFCRDFKEYRSRNEYVRTLLARFRDCLLLTGQAGLIELPDLGDTGYLPYYYDRETAAMMGTLEANGFSLSLHEFATRAIYRHFWRFDERVRRWRQLVHWYESVDTETALKQLQSRQFNPFCSR